MTDTTADRGYSSDIFRLIGSGLNGYFGTEQQKVAAKNTAHTYGSHTTTDSGATVNNATQNGKAGASALPSWALPVGIAAAALLVAFIVLK